MVTWLPIGCAILSGAAIVSMETLGARLVSPFFGSAVHVWAAVVAVTLTALACGYGAGGWLADRESATVLLPAVLLTAGIAHAPIPIFRAPVLEVCAHAGPVAGAILASAALLFVPLFFSAAVFPAAVRAATASLESVGRSAGTVALASSAAGALSCLATAFFLLPRAGAAQVVWSLSAMLAAPGAAWFAFRRHAAGLAATGIWLAVFGSSVSLGRRPLYDGPAGRVVEKSESVYGERRVVEFGGLRLLMVDGTVQGGIRIPKGGDLYGYPDVMDKLIRVWKKATARAEISGIVCGLGPGNLPTYLRDAARCEVFELDSDVVRLAERHFAFDPLRQPVSIGDARWLARARPAGQTDFVVLDAYSSESPPLHLEGLGVFKRLLRPGGLLVLNLLSRREGGGSESARAIGATLHAVFREQICIAAHLEDGYGSLIFAGSDGALGPIRESLPADLRSELAVFPVRPDLVLTDDRNGLDLLMRENAMAMRRSVWNGMPHALLLE